MTYSIIFFQNERELGRSPWDRGLTAAKQHAKDYMPIHKADRVEIRDENGTLVFHHPRTLKNANRT